MEALRYKAFISYSHRDEKWARWLQRALEAYRVPRRLVGRDSAFGAIPGRLQPVFRDREELSSAADLSAEIKTALADSEFLIVICSPTAAASRWVNEEVRHFRQLGRGHRILALVVDGDPQAGGTAAGCFPPALLETDDGGRREPLAADVRKYADGRSVSRLKIVAGMLGIRLDELRQRDAQRRTRQRLGFSLAAVVLIAVVGWLVYAESKTRAAAEVQRAGTEELLSFMLGDLERLDPIEGLERISPDDEVQRQLRGELGLEELDADELLAEALRWREAGQQRQWRGERSAAFEQFKNSRAALIELHLREGNTPRALFELGQAEYYVGEVHVSMGDIALARQSWSHYGALTRRLLNAEPNNPKYVMELSYTLMNLGALELQQASPDVDKSLQLLQSAVQYNQLALVLDPGNSEFRESLVNELNWLADAFVDTCELGRALETRQQTVQLRREYLAANAADVHQQRELAFTLTGLAGVQQQIGLSESAIASFEEAVERLKQLRQAEPGNQDIEWQALYREARLARLLMALAQEKRAFAILDPMAERINELAMAAGDTDLMRATEAVRFNLDYARLLIKRGAVAEGEPLLRETMARAAGQARLKPEFRDVLKALARAAFEHWRQFGSLPGGDVENLLTIWLDGSAPLVSCPDAGLAARLSVARGDLSLARRFTDYVLGKGYFEADFIGFCTEYGLCDSP